MSGCLCSCARQPRKASTHRRCKKKAWKVRLRDIKRYAATSRCMLPFWDRAQFVAKTGGTMHAFVAEGCRRMKNGGRGGVWSF